MNKEQLEKKVREMIGLSLIPGDTKIDVLNLEMADLLIFKEGLDMTFGDIFEVEKLSACETINELISYVVETVQKQPSDEKQNKVQDKNPEGLDENIGFLILELSANDTKPLKWNSLPQKVQKIFQKSINSGIDVEKAEIQQKDQNLFTLSYSDAGDDFSASYIVYQEKLIFSYEN